MSCLPVCIGVIYSVNGWVREFYKAFCLTARVVLIIHSSRVESKRHGGWLLHCWCLFCCGYLSLIVQKMKMYRRDKVLRKEIMLTKD